MNNFFDRFKPGADDKSKAKNPLTGWFNGSNATSFSGTGQSLGGALPGTVIAVTLDQPGSLGIQIEKGSTNDSAIVARVVPDSQAAVAGLQRGDIVCFAGSDGTEEIVYDMFLQLAASTQRPLCFEVRRVPKTKIKESNSNSNTTGSNGTTATAKTTTTSAETFARKQAVIAAAEKRELAHKKLFKPLPKRDIHSVPKLLSTVERLKLEEDRRHQQQQHDLDPTAHTELLSAATKAALEQAKHAELETVHQLGYNPYESKSMTSGQARNAVTATTHGSMRDSPPDTATTTATTTATMPTPALSAEARPSPNTIQETNQLEPSLEFMQSFETTVTSSTDHTAVIQSITILRKLIVNATTKGQMTTALTNGDNHNDEATSKFRKVRLANPKIRATVTDMVGAVNVLLSVGFQLHSEGDESILVFPLGDVGPLWLPTALRHMEQYVHPATV